jgi:integrase
MMLIKRNKVWHYQTKVHGRTFKRSTGQTDKRKAVEMATSFQCQARLLRQLSTTSPRCSLHEAIVEEVQRIEMDVGPGRAKRVKGCLMNFARWIGRDLALERLPGDTVTQYQRFRLARTARGTVKAEIGAVMRMLRGRPHSVQKPPAIGHGRFNPNRAFTDPELQAIFQAVTPRYRDLYLVLFTTGARLAEIVPSGRSAHIALLKGEVDYERGVVTIRTAKQKPGGRPSEPRMVHVPHETLDAIRREAAGTFGPHVFSPIHNAARDFQHCLRRAGVVRRDPLGRRATLHSFRHTYATKAAEVVGQNQFLLQRILGHAQIGTTAQYCHPTAPPILVDLGFLEAGRTKRNTEGSQAGFQGGETEAKASA